MAADTRPLYGCRVVVTRSRPGRLGEQLESAGATVVSAPAIAFAAPDDDGAALRSAIGRLENYGWLVVTSATAVEVLAEALEGAELPRSLRIAAVGPATAHAVGRLGATVDLVPGEAISEALVEAFPPGPGRVLQLRPEVARDVVARGLREKQWEVDEVVAYRTVAAALDAETARSVSTADAITFLSPSAVDHLIAGLGVDALPAMVVSIGPVTSAALVRHGIAGFVEADPHTVDGILDALILRVGHS